MPPTLRAAAAHGISYREAVDEDVPFLAAVYFSTRAEELEQTGWPDEIKHRFLTHQFNAQHVDYRRNYKNAEWLVIERGGEGIGRLYIEEWDEEVRIIDIALLPSARRSGIGAAIMADVIADANALGKPVSIHVERNNPARGLYERLGFVMVEEGAVYDRMHYDGRLSPPPAPG